MGLSYIKLYLNSTNIDPNPYVKLPISTVGGKISQLLLIRTYPRRCSFCRHNVHLSVLGSKKVLFMQMHLHTLAQRSTLFEQLLNRFLLYLGASKRKSGQEYMKSDFALCLVLGKSLLRNMHHHHQVQQPVYNRTKIYQFQERRWLDDDVDWDGSMAGGDAGFMSISTYWKQSWGLSALQAGSASVRVMDIRQEVRIFQAPHVDCIQSTWATFRLKLEILS